MKLEYYQNGSGELQTIVLKSISGDIENKTMIDLCCGSAPQTAFIPFKEKVYVDVIDRDLPDNSDIIFADVIEYLKNNQDKVYDISISTDTIEHFRDNDALEFLSLTNNIAKKKIWFTPLGEYCMTNDQNDNNPDSHKSEWRPEKLEQLMPDKWAYIVFPNWHPTLGENGVGAFFFWTCDDLKKDFERVKKELNILK